MTCVLVIHFQWMLIFNVLLAKYSCVFNSTDYPTYDVFTSHEFQMDIQIQREIR